MADYDVMVIGSGPGGYVCAIRAAQLGSKVAIVEPRELGGTCLNRGCIPTKALLETANVFRHAKEGEKFGVLADNPRLDLAKAMAYKESVVTKLRNGVGFLMKKNKIDVLVGRGKLAGPKQVVVTDAGGATKTYATEKIVIATGSVPARPKAFPIDGKLVMTSDEMLTLDSVPKTLLVVGGGYIGCEFASMFREYGSEVTIVEMLPRILPLNDEDISAELTRSFKKAGIKIHTDTKVEAMTVSNGQVKVKLSGGKELSFDKALISIGRAAVTEGLGLEEAGVQLDGKFIGINAHCQTSVPNIYAIGDVTGKMMLAHAASKQGIIAAEHLHDHDARMSYRVVPAAVFTHPEVSNVGLSEAQAREKGVKVKTAKFQFQALGKALVLGDPVGFVKIVADEETGEVLGVHMIGPHVSDLIAEAALAMRLEATVRDIAHTIHTHPTLAEATGEAAEGWLGHMIHG